MCVRLSGKVASCHHAYSTMAIDWVMRQRVQQTDGVHLAPMLRITDLAYADDLVLLAADRDKAHD